MFLDPDYPQFYPFIRQKCLLYERITCTQHNQGSKSEYQLLAQNRPLPKYMIVLASQAEIFIVVQQRILQISRSSKILMCP